MTSRTRRTLLLASFVLCLVALAAWVGVRLDRQQPVAAGVTPVGKAGDLLVIEGYNTSNYLGGRLVSRIEAEQLSIAPHKVGIFRIRMYDRFTLDNARIDFFPELAGDETGFLAFDEIKAIRKGHIRDLVLTFHDAQGPALRLTAETADVNLHNDRIKLTKAILEHLGSGRRIAGRAMFWDGATKLFTIPGAFFAESPSGKQTGKEVTIDLDFSLSKPIFTAAKQ